LQTKESPKYFDKKYKSLVTESSQILYEKWLKNPNMTFSSPTQNNQTFRSSHNILYTQ